MAKKETQKPVIILTRAGMEAALNEYKQLKLDHVAATAAMEKAMAAVVKQHEGEINRLATEIELKFGSLHNYCATHRDELLVGDRKSFETVTAVVKFYDTPHRVEKVGKETLAEKAKRLLGLVFKLDEQTVLDCAKYVRDGDPELNKDALLADRKKFTPQQLKAMGVRFDSDEVFAIDLKSDLAEGDKTTEEAQVAA